MIRTACSLSTTAWAVNNGGPMASLELPEDSRRHTFGFERFTIIGVHTLIIATAVVIGLTTIPALASSAEFGPDNPFFAPSTLPFQAPPFDKIKDSDYQPAMEAGMAEELKEVQVIADNPAPVLQIADRAKGLGGH